MRDVGQAGRWFRAAAMVVATLGGACGDDGGPVATYRVPASGTLAWGDAPFPNDLYLGSDGTVDLAPKADWAPVWQTVVEHLGTRTGFCGTCAIHFPISAPIDPATLADNVVLIDAQGSRVPIDVEWDGTASVIALVPRRGVVLTPGERYVAGITNKVRGADGVALRADGGFTSARAKPVHDAALAALQTAGVTDTVVAATAFTVEDPRWLANDLEQRVQQYFATNGAPTVTVTKVWRQGDGSLDELLGIPAVAQPGLDNPSMAGTVGTYAVVHDTIEIAIKGTFNSVRVIEGDGPVIGRLTGETRVGDNVPFLLIVPQGVDVTNLPVIVFHHGASGVIGQAFALADMAGRAHTAFLALETYLHGERSPSPVDDYHALRGDDGELGPDGLAEQNATELVLQFLSISGAAPDEKGSPLYGLGAIAQMVADYHALLTLATSSDLSPIAAADASLTGLAFDTSRIYYLGLSMGTVVGAVALAADTKVKAGVFNVPVSSLAETLVENEAFRTQVELLVLPALDVPNETYEPERHLLAQPLMSLYRWVEYPVEPLALARHNATRPGRDLLWQVAGLDELAGTPAGEALVAVAGVPAVGEFASVPVTAGTAPIAGSGAWRFAQADHLTIGNRGGSSKYVPPALPPFEARATLLNFENPIDEVQDQITHFFDSHRMTGTAEIR